MAALALTGPSNALSPAQRAAVLSATKPVFQTDFTAGTLNPAISFSRATTGTYYNSSGVLSSASIDAPRFDYDPSALTARGLLIEEQRTNVALRSNTFTTGWAAAGITVVKNATGPDGTTSAWTWTAAATNNIHGTNTTPGASVTAGAVTASIYAKYTNNQWLAVGLYDGSWHVAVFDVQNGVVGNKNTSVTSSITAAGNGWYRLSMTYPVSSTSANMIAFLQPSNTTTMNWTAAGTETALFYEAQEEQGSFSTSDIPTTTAAVTRSADLISSGVTLAAQLAAGPSILEATDLVTKATTRTAFAAGAFSWPTDKWLRSMAVYAPGTDTSAHMTVGSPY